MAVELRRPLGLPAELHLHGEVILLRAEAGRLTTRRGYSDVALRYLAGQDETIAGLAVALLSEAEADVALAADDEAEITARAA